MKFKSLVSVFCATIIVNLVSLPAFAELKLQPKSDNSIYSCNLPLFAPNTWAVTINVAQEKGVFDFGGIFQVFSTLGFATTPMINLGNDDYYVNLSFNADLYGDKAQAEFARISGVDTLLSLEGVNVSCVARYETNPAVSIR